MSKINLRSALSVSSAFVLLVLVVIAVQAFAAAPVAAQTAPCVDPFTGAQCTPTSPPRCGLPGLPPCENPPSENASPTHPPQVILHPTFTPTPTISPTPTIVASPTATITPIPTSTPFPTPTPNPFIPLLAPIPKLIGLFHPPEGLVIQLPPWMMPDNLKVTDLEITQGIQCLHNPGCPDNSVALYSGKTTMVRAYVRLTGGPDSSVYPIGGALCYGNTGAAGCVNPILPVQKIYVPNISDPVGYARSSASLTLDFKLPSSYVSGFTTQTLTVYVNYKFQDLPSESYYKDNYKTLQYQVQPSEPIYVKFYPVQDKGFFPPGFEWVTLTNYLAKTYPTGQVYPWVGFPLYGKDYDWTTADPWGCPKGWHNLINDLWFLRGGSGPIAYGEVPFESLSGGVIGCGVLGGPEAAGIAGKPSDGRVAAQEIGHTMNLPHVPGCGAGGPDMSYPNSTGLLDEFGIDPYTLQVYSPISNYDFMGYCGGGTNTWTSIYTYDEIAGLLPQGAYNPGYPHLASLASLLQPEQVLVGSGELSPTSASLTQGFYLIDRTSFKTLTPDQGPYTVELQDASGHVLYSQHFDLAQMSNDDPQTEGGFQLALPWTDGVRKVVFKYQDQVIGHTTASAHAPSLELTSPSGGETWAATGQQTITWTAADTDHDPLSYMLQYSADDGKNWMMMAANLQDPTFTFDADYLPGSDHGVIRVVATDGFNTTQVDSNQVSVAAKAPLVAITSPLEADSFEFGTPVILQAAATDLLDGPILNSNQLTWSSDKDGGLGNGTQLILSNLSAGEHTITLSVQNSSGLVSTASVHITINPPVTSANPNRLMFTDFLPLALLFAALIALIVLAVFAIRRSRSRMRKA